MGSEWAFSFLWTGEESLIPWVHDASLKLPLAVRLLHSLWPRVNFVGTFGVVFTKQSQISEREKHYYPLTVLDKVSPLTFISAVFRQALTNVSNSESETKKQIDVHSTMSVCTIHEHNLIHLKLHLWMTMRAISLSSIIMLDFVEWMWYWEFHNLRCTCVLWPNETNFSLSVPDYC